MRLFATLFAVHDTLSALRLLLGFVAPNYLLPQAITRAPTLATVGPTRVRTSLRSLVPASPPTVPSPSTPKLVFARLARSAEQAGQWVTDTRSALAHDLCHTRPPLIHTPRAKQIYHRLFLLRLRLCASPALIDSLPRPRWKLPPRRPVRAIPRLPPPGTRVVQAPTRTERTAHDGPLPPRPAHIKPRRPPPPASSPPLSLPSPSPSPSPSSSSPPPPEPMSSQSKDAFESLLQAMLGSKARFQDLITRPCARISEHAWLVRFKSSFGTLELPTRSVWALLSIGLAGALVALGQSTTGRTRNPRRPVQPPSPSPPHPAPEPTHERQPRRYVKLSYRLEVRAYENRYSPAFYRVVREYPMRGVPEEQRARMEARGLAYLQSSVRLVEMGLEDRGKVRLMAVVLRRLTSWDQIGDGADARRTDVQHQGDVFRSVEDYGETLIQEHPSERS